MKKTWWQQIKNSVAQFLRSLYQLRNGELLRFLFFLLIATTIWFLHSTQAETQSTITYPITYKELPGHITVSNKLLNSIQVTVKDKGGRLYAYYLKRNRQALEVDLLSLHNHKGIASVSTKHFESKIYSFLKPSAQIIRIQPDSLSVYFVENESKQIAVSLRSDIEPAPQHMITGELQITPAYIYVSAPVAVLDSLNHIETELLSLQNLSDTTTVTVQLQEVDGLRYSQKEVEVSIPIEAFTECSFDIPLQGFNFPEGYQLRSFPAKVNVSFLIQESLYPQMKAEDFLIGIDYEQLLASPQGIVEPKVVKTPSHIQRLLIKPQHIDCLIEEL